MNRKQGLTLLFLGFFLAGSNLAFAEQKSTLKKEPPAKHSSKKISGTFKIIKVKKHSHQQNQIWFSNVDDSKIYVLNSHYTNQNLREGSQYRMVAEVFEDRKGQHHIQRALVYLPFGETTVPIWILSKDSKLNLNLDKYIRLHAPTTDYIVL